MRTSIAADNAPSIHPVHPPINWSTQKQIYAIQSLTLTVLLGILNMLSKMSRALVFLLTKYGGLGLKQWSIIDLARQIQLLSTTISSSSIVRFLFQTSLHTTQLEYVYNTNFLANNNPTINIGGVTPTWLTKLWQNFQQGGIQLDGGWSVTMQQVGDFHIADSSAWMKVPMTSQRWKLFHKTFIFLQVTTIVDETTACGCYFTPAFLQVAPSYPLIFQWPCQQHNITNHQKILYTQILAANTKTSK